MQSTNKPREASYHTFTLTVLCYGIFQKSCFARCWEEDFIYIGEPYQKIINNELNQN